MFRQRSEDTDLDGDGRSEIIAAFTGERSLSAGVVRCGTNAGVEVWKTRLTGQ